MYKTFKNLSEIMKQKISNVYETKENYYVTIDQNDPWDNSIYEVNKKTKNVKSIMFTDFIVDVDDYKQIDVDEFVKFS